MVAAQTIDTIHGTKLYSKFQLSLMLCAPPPNFTPLACVSGTMRKAEGLVEELKRALQREEALRNAEASGAGALGRASALEAAAAAAFATPSKASPKSSAPFSSHHILLVKAAGVWSPQAPEFVCEGLGATGTKCGESTRSARGPPARNVI